MGKDTLRMYDGKRTDHKDRFATAIRINIEQHRNRTGKSCDCVIVATEEMLEKVDEALLSLGIPLNAIIDEALPRRSIIFCTESDLDIWKIQSE